MDFDKDREKQILRALGLSEACRKSFKGDYREPTNEDSYRAGANWGHKWASDKGVGHLLEWMKDINKKREDRLHEQWRVKWEQALDSRDGLIKEIDELKEKLSHLTT